MTSFIYGIDGILGFEKNGQTYYYKKKLQGDIIGIIDSNGQEIARYTYDAWGNHKISYYNGSEFVDILPNTDYTSIINATIALFNPFRYRGYYYDTETDLYYLNSRYYDPEIGRFINADDISVLDITNVALNGLNLYAYCLNNPVNEVDENGYFISFLVALGVAALIGSLVGAVGYAGSVIIRGITTNNWDWSWGDFLGSILGGAIGGIFSLVPGVGLYVGAFMGALATTIISYAFTQGSDFDFQKSFKEGFLWGIISAGTAGIMKNMGQYSKFYGRGSYNQVSKQMYTKLFRNQIQKISLKTFNKMLKLELYVSLLNPFKVVF